MNQLLAERDSEDDYSLVLRLKSGDRSAIDQAVDRYSKPLYAFILRMTAERETAEDVFQETWVRVIRNIGFFRGDAKFSTWLFQIALNLCRNLARQKSRRTYIDIDQADQLSEEPEADGRDPLLSRKIKKLVASLPDKMREVIVLRFYHDRTDQEIAEI
ncbi:MAG TPA: sigma-70 family RNA polymerase sigma factor, partial [Candidatus Glassbacteria bacterium]|nr:sigma-70 family RNA polymerase sigma factor [Candidatus Glassbacteria bacterium]